MVLPMPSWPECVRQVHAVLRLMRLDASGLAGFDLSVDGFWRSFGLILLIAPAGLFFDVLSEMLYPAAGVPASSGDLLWMVLVEGVRDVALWFGIPLLLVPVVRGLHAEAGYGAYIVAGNWSNLVLSLVFWGIRLIALATGGMGAGISLLALVLLLFSIGYTWYLASITLRAGPLASTAVVLLDLVVSMALRVGADALTGPAVPEV